MMISDIISIINKTAKENNIDLNAVSFDDIRSFYKQSTKLRTKLSKMVKDGFEFKMSELNLINDPFTRAYIDFFIDDNQLPIVDDLNTKSVEEILDEESGFVNKPEEPSNYEYTSEKAVNDLLQKSVLFTREEELAIFKKIRPYTQRIVELEAQIRTLTAERVAEYKAYCDANCGIDYSRSYAYHQEIEKIVNDVKVNSKEAKEALRLRNEIKPEITEIYQANIKWVKSLANRNNYRSTATCDTADIFAMGEEGFLKAVINFDVEKGFKFSTYATWWINQAITRGIADEGRTIRIPVHLFEKVNKYHRTFNKLTAELNREPYEEEVAAALNMSIAELRNLIRYSTEATSLDTPVGEEEDSVLGDFVYDEDSMLPEEYAEYAQLKVLMQEVLSTLTPREQKVLRMRFGFDGRVRTLEEVGREEGVTRERIRQIEAKALKKLRIPARSRRLKDYAK